ncbi:MAG: putative bifunctional diguanylate cyclase/phosphodiesterase [Culicoidibacterales bacterium]
MQILSLSTIFNKREYPFLFQMTNKFCEADYDSVQRAEILASSVIIIDRECPNFELLVTTMHVNRQRVVFIIEQESDWIMLQQFAMRCVIEALVLPLSQAQWEYHTFCWKERLKIAEQQYVTQLKLETFMNTVPFMTWFKDVDSHYINTSEAFQIHCGKHAADVVGRDDTFVWDGNIGERCREFDLQVMNNREQIRFEEVIPGTRGHRHFHVYKAPVIDDLQTVLGTIGIATDITDTLNEQSKLSVLIENLPFAMCMRDTEGNVLHINSKYQEHVKNPMAVGDNIYAPKFLAREMDLQKVRRQDKEVIAKKESVIFRSYLERNGEERVFEFQKTPFSDVDNKITGIIVIIRDITEQVNQERSIKKLAYEDSLTNLANRSGMYQHLQKYYREPIDGVAIFIDLDNFKQLNDSYGHSIGNKLLQAVALRIRESFPEAFIARDGGDEFTILFSLGKKNKIDIEKKAKQLLILLNEPIQYQHQNYQVFASIGIVTGDITNETIDELILKGETALQAAKNYGKNQVVCYTPELDENKRLQMEFIADFKQALEEEKVELFYQPQYTCHCELIGFEALMRWFEPKYRHLNVMQMFEYIESSTIVYETGEYVMRKAMMFAKKINQVSDQPLKISINVSAHQVMADDFVHTVKQCLKSVEISADIITLEITETVLLQDSIENIEKLKQLRALGFGLALDDFGTGYSSMNYLVKLPLSQVKIDRSFIRELTTSTQYQTLVKMMIEAAHVMNMPVVAEGVETKAELHLLSQWQGDYIQGYYFSAPVNEQEAFTKVVEQCKIK